jgi:5-methyltetrahydrofolate--homocysteine methyltransferase
MKNPRRKELALPSLWADLQAQALRMRRRPTRAEERLWQELRGGRIGGLRFRRQHPVGRFIADFYCVQAALIVEIDGPIHSTQMEADEERAAFLASMGLRVVRFTNDEVLANLSQVIERIRRAAFD